MAALACSGISVLSMARGHVWSEAPSRSARGTRLTGYHARVSLDVGVLERLYRRTEVRRRDMHSRGAGVPIGPAEICKVQLFEFPDERGDRPGQLGGVQFI